MMTFLILIGVVGLVIAALFLGAWVLDAKRAEKVGNDEERLDVDNDAPTNQPHGTDPRGR